MTLSMGWVVERVDRPQEHFGSQGVDRYPVAIFAREEAARRWAVEQMFETEVYRSDERE